MPFSHGSGQSKLEKFPSAPAVGHWNTWCSSTATPEDPEVRESIRLSSSSFVTLVVVVLLSLLHWATLSLLKCSISYVLNLRQKEESSIPAPLLPLVFICHFKANITLIWIDLMPHQSLLNSLTCWTSSIKCLRPACPILSSIGIFPDRSNI